MDSIDPNPQGQTFAVERNPRLRYIIPAVVAVAFLMEQLDSTILVTAVPDIARSLDTTPLRMNLAVTTYILTLAMFIPVSGWFADRFGARRIFTLSLFIFTIGSILCGLATSLPMLIATRALQGFGGAMLLGLVTLDGSPLTPEKFHIAFLLMAVIPLLGIPGFLKLQPEDGMQVSGHQRLPKT